MRHLKDREGDHSALYSSRGNLRSSCLCVKRLDGKFADSKGGFITDLLKKKEGSILFGFKEDGKTREYIEKGMEPYFEEVKKHDVLLGKCPYFNRLHFGFASDHEE